MPTPCTDTAAASPTVATTAASAVALDGVYAADLADLADLLRCLRTWIEAEHDQLDPLLAKHDYDITGLRVALDLHAALLRSSDDRPPI